MRAIVDDVTEARMRDVFKAAAAQTADVRRRGTRRERSGSRRTGAGSSTS